MKKIILLGILAISSFSSTLLQSNVFDINNKNVYLTLFGGANFLDVNNSGGIKPNFHPGYIVAGELGLEFCSGYRFEVEYAYRRNTLKKLHFFGQNFTLPGHVQTSSYMANVLWDVPLIGYGKYKFCFKPYVGLGVGYDVQRWHAEQDNFFINENKKGFAWQLMTGLRYQFFDKFETNIEYKFHKGPLTKFYNHSIGLGLTYKFGFDCCNDNEYYNNEYVYNSGDF